MPLMKDALTLDEYVGVLRRLNRVVRSWERWAVEHAPSDLTEVVVARRRSGWLRQDLEWARSSWASDEEVEFQAGDVPGLECEMPRFRASFLGAMYVMEGSTLGGQYIARHLERVLTLKPGEGDAYFRGYGDRTGEMWRSFKAVLAEVPEEESERVIAAAIGMFRWFGRAMVSKRID